jgi:hypothetical protein
MLKYKLENKLEDFTFICEVCGKKTKLEASLNEYYKDGTIKKHYACSKHIIILYNKIIK